jgi:hypothetical protein
MDVDVNMEGDDVRFDYNVIYHENRRTCVL